MANRQHKAANSTASRKGASSTAEADSLQLSPDSEKIMMAIESLGTKMDTQTAALRQEIVSIRQELHSTVNSLQSANAQNTKRIDDLEQSTTEWSSSVMTLETTVRQLQSEVCSLADKCLDLEGRSRRQNIRLIGIEEGVEGKNPRQFCATILKEILDLEDTPRLDRGHRSLAPKPRKGERPRPFIIRVHHEDVKDRILRISSQKKKLFYMEKRVHIFPDFAPEVAKKRAAFTEARRLLKDVKDVKYGIRFPAIFRITFWDEEKSFTDPELAISYIKENILPSS